MTAWADEFARKSKDYQNISTHLLTFGGGVHVVVVGLGPRRWSLALKRLTGGDWCPEYSLTGEFVAVSRRQPAVWTCSCGQMNAKVYSVCILCGYPRPETCT